MLTTEQCTEFEDVGFVRLPGVFCEADAAPMREVLWRELTERYGMVRDDPGSWTTLRPYTLKSTKHHKAFAAMAGPTLIEAIEQLLGPGGWRPPKNWGQVMVTMPSPGHRWELPRTLWHCDYPFTLPAHPLPAVKMFAFFGEVDRHGGGTLVIARSHRVVARFVASLDRSELDDYKGLRARFIAHHPWWRGLRSGREAVDGLDRAEY